MARSSQLCILPIHRISEDEYYRKYEKHVARMKQRQSQLLRSLLPEHQEEQIRRWEAPYWLHNGIAGYLEIHSAAGPHLFGMIFIKRKYFPKYEASISCGSTAWNNQIVLFAETTKAEAYPQTKIRYANAAEMVIVECEEILHDWMKNAKVWLPPHWFKALDLALLDEAIKENKDSEVV